VTIINDQYPVLTSSRKGIFFQKDYYDGNQIASENNTGYNIVPYGYFTYRHMSDDEIFYFNINDIIDNGIVSTLYPVFTTNNRLDSKFLQYELNFGKEFRKYSALQKQGGSRTYMYFNKLRDLQLTITTSLKEQECIRNLICSIDHLITLHQSKSFGYILEAIVSYTLYWEQRKLGEVFEEYSEKNHSELPPLTIIQGGGTIRRDESDRALQYDMNSLSNYKMVNKDDFIVHLRSFEGGLEKANSKGIISPAYHTFSGENTDATFYYTYFRSEKFIESDLKPHVYGIRDGRSIDVEGMKSINIPYTIFEEQRHIGYLIDSINHLITLHQLEPFQLIFKAIAYRIIDYTKSKPPRCR